MAIDYASEFDESENDQYWREKLKNQPVIENPAPRTPWKRFIESIDNTIRHYSPVAAGARAVQRSIPLNKSYNEATGGETPAQRRARLVQEERDWREVESKRDPSKKPIDYAAEFGGSFVGGMVSDPTNLINPGSSLSRQALNQLIIGGVSDAALQGAEMKEGVRDNYDPLENLISAAAGPALLGTVHGARLGVDRLNGARRVHAGSRMPNYESLLDKVVRLEGGGTLDNPKTSPKGAKGPMQVMDATARNPGFGIRPWDGKTEADRARVGRQYLAALNHKYGGDEAKVLAAYNGGPGRVDAAVRKYGDEWLRAMPLESRKYVRNGLRGSEDLRGPLWQAADETFTDSPDALRDLINDRPSTQEEAKLEPIREALMRQAEDDSGGFVNDQPELWRQEWTNQDLAPKPEHPAYIEDIMNKYPDIKDPIDYTDDEWYKMSMEKKAAASSYGHYLDSVKAKKVPVTAAEEYKANLVKKNPGLYAMADKEGISPGTPEFNKKYGYEDKYKQADDALTKEADDLFQSGLYNSYDEAFTAAKNSTKFKGKYSDAEANKYEQKPFDPEDEDTWAIDDNESDGPYLGDEYDDFEPEPNIPSKDIWHGKNGPIEYYAPFEGGNHYYGVADYEKITGKKVGALTKQAIKDFGELMGLQDTTVASHYFSDSGDAKLKEELKSYQDNLAKQQMKPKEYKAYLNYKDGDPIPKILAKYLGPPQPPKPPSPLKKSLKNASETFLEMLKDNSGKMAEPDKFHEAITEWNKGTHYLMKGPDGTPLRIYHGTRIPYEGLPSGEQNKMPPGYVLYSTDPDFASSYAKFYPDEPYYNSASRVFPAYVKNDKRIADFRKPEDLKKAVDWHKKRFGEEMRWGTEAGLAKGDWVKWENPEMLEELGWRGAFMTENGSVNIMLKDDLVMSILDPKTYKNDTIAHKIVNTLSDLLKDESGSYRITDPLDTMDPDERTLLEALKDARKLSGETRSMYRAEKGKRGAQLGRIQQEGLGETGLYAQMKQAKGEMPKADFESLRGAFSQEQIDRLINKINDSKALLPWEKFKASMAMGKLIGLEGANFSKAPTMSDIKLLEKVYSSELIRSLMKDMTFKQKVVQGIFKTLSIPRAIMSSMDLSAPFRQGLNYIHKPEWRSAFFHMFKLIGSEANSKALMDEIYSRPTWELMKRAKLAITDPHSHFISEHEEGFQGSDWAEKIPIIGSIGIKASNRAYSGFLNKLRADVFDDYVRQYEKAGINLAADTAKLREVAAFVNAATGRGNLPKKMEPAAQFLSSVFFSPRLIASRLKFIANPMTYLNADPILRKEAWKSAFSLAAVAISVGALGKYGLGMDLETDPRSSDFMKPKVGNTRYDIMGGYQQYITLAARFITQQDVTSSGNVRDFDKDNPTANTRGTAVLKFARNKLSPVASFVTDWLMGKDTVGRDFSLPRAAADRITPMAAGDIADAFEEWKNDSVAKGPAMASPGVFGVGVQTYDPDELKAEKEAKKPVEVDKEFSSEFSDEFSTVDFSKEFE